MRHRLAADLDVRVQPTTRAADRPLADRLGEWREVITAYVGEHPKTSLIALFSVGAFIGWWLKRR